MPRSIDPATTPLALTTARDGTVRFDVHAKPRAKASRIGGVTPAGALEIALAAPPVDGAANEEMVRLLAKALGLPKRSVTLVHGEASREKVVAIAGLGAEAILARLRGER